MGEWMLTKVKKLILVTKTREVRKETKITKQARYMIRSKQDN